MPIIERNPLDSLGLVVIVSGAGVWYSTPSSLPYIIGAVVLALIGVGLVVYGGAFGLFDKE